MAPILTLGDSFTFGAELSDLPVQHVGIFGNDYTDPVTGQHLTIEPSGLAWPALVAERLGTGVDNHAIIGGSNGRIFRRAISDSSRKSYSLVVCAWTQLSRMDIAYQGREFPASAGNPVWPWIKNYFADHYDEAIEQQRLLTQILALQSYFKQRNQPYVFIKSMLINFDAGFAYLHDQIDQTHCIAWDSSMRALAQHCPQGPLGHFLEAGHQAVADAVLEHLGTRL